MRRRGYIARFIEGELRKLVKLKREDLLECKEMKKNNDKRITLVITYNRQLPDIHRIDYKHLSILYKSERLQKAFEAPPLVAFR